MKDARFELRLEPSLKRCFEAAAAFEHQSLSQFAIQSMRYRVDDCRGRGLAIKPPPAPRDARRKRQRVAVLAGGQA